MRRSLAIVAFLAACGGQTAAPTVVTESIPNAPLPVERPVPEAVADDVGTPSALALDGDLVVFTTRATMLNGALVHAGALFVADKRSPDALMIGLDREGATYLALATDGTTAFVATSDDRIISVPLRGGEEKELAKLDGPAGQIAVARDYVYVATETRVARVAKAGGTVETVSDVVARGLVGKDDAIFVAAADGTIARIENGVTKPIATGAGQPCAVARDEGQLFWTAADAAKNTAIMKVGLEGGDATTIASGSFAACALAADSASLYFATTLPDSLPVRNSSASSAPGLGLMRAPLAGGSPVAIAEATHALAQPGAVAVDTVHLYWLTPTSVMRLAK